MRVDRGEVTGDEKLRVQGAVRAACARPPEGWACTRGEHPDGPCAAVPAPPFVKLSDREREFFAACVARPDDAMRERLGLDRSLSVREVRAELADVKDRWRNLSERHVDLLNAIRDVANNVGIGTIGDDLVDVVGALGAEVVASRETVRTNVAQAQAAEATAQRLSGLARRWRGHAEEMATIKDDMARLLGREQHAHQQTRQAAEDWEELAMQSAGDFNRLYRQANEVVLERDHLRADRDQLHAALTEMKTARSWRGRAARLARVFGIEL